MKSWQRVASNVVLFQAGWFACVLGAARGAEGWGVLAAGAVVAWHVACAARPRRELALVASVAAIGACLDSALLRSGSLVFHSAWPAAWPPGLAPAWILALWALFGTTLNVSLRWLRGRGLLAAALGAIGGPLTYWAGVRLGAATLTQPVRAGVLMALAWAVLMPALIRLARRYDGPVQESAAETAAEAAAPGGAAPSRAAPPVAGAQPTASTRGQT